MKRLFFALWPDDSVRGKCGEIVRKLPRGTLRPVAAANLHITLLFLGAIDTETECGIISAAAEVPIVPMTLVFDSLSYWKAPKILCLTGGEFCSSLSELSRRLGYLATRFGVPIDLRPFKPHITVARKANAPVSLAFEPIVWLADSFCLVESCSTITGVEYRVLNRWSCVYC